MNTKNRWNKFSDLLKPYYEKSFDQIHQNILAFCEYFRKEKYIELDLKMIDEFVESLFFVFSQPDFGITKNDVDRYFLEYLTIANLIRISSYKNSDKVLEKLIENLSQNIIKILILYSAYNQIRLRIKTLMFLDPTATSLWFCKFLSVFQAAVSDTNAFTQLNDHLLDSDIELNTITDIKPIFFGITYINQDLDRYWKSKFNQLIQRKHFLGEIQEIKPLKRNRIAIISGCWYENHSVYRNQYHFLKALSEKYELHLFSVTPLQKNLDPSIFKEFHYIVMPNGKIDASQIEAGNYPLIYFTDIGMHAETTILSNTRLAPIQVTSYGHSVSTFGSKIDYWIGGIKGEQGSSHVDLATIQSRYSETFIGLPGLGITHTYPSYTIKNISKRADRFVINCPSCAHKVNAKLIYSLKNILKKVQCEDIVFQIFSCTYGLTFHTYKQILHEQLGPHVEVIFPASYAHYMELLETGQFSIEAYPFGGCNTVVDALWLRQPIVCLEGERWYNKIGTATLLKLGIDPQRNTMLASNSEQYENNVVNLVNDSQLLEQARQEILHADLNTLFDNSESYYFVQAIDQLLNSLNI